MITFAYQWLSCNAENVLSDGSSTTPPKFLQLQKTFDKILLTERNVESKCKHISDLKTKPHPEQRHAEVISRSSTSNLMASQLENECVKRRKEKKRAERLANAELTFSFAQRRADDPKITSEASGETLKSPKLEFWPPCKFTLLTGN